MRVVPPANRFGVLDGDDLADDLLLAKELAEEDVVRRVAQDVADAVDLGRVAVECGFDAETVGEGEREWLLAQNV